MVRPKFDTRRWFIAALFVLLFTAACGGSQGNDGALPTLGGDPADGTTATNDEGADQPVASAERDAEADTGADSPVSISAGNRQSCVVTPAREVQCWGTNNFGQVGAGSSEGSDGVVTVGGLPAIAQVTAGGSHNCALSVEAEVWCWGNNEGGQLGSDVMPWTEVPQRVEGLSNVVSVAAGGESVCAVAADGVVWCWGSNLDGELGSAEFSSNRVPQPIDSIPGAVSISGGARGYCAIGEGGGVWCWGNNTFGQTGIAPSEPVRTPVQVPGVADAVQVSLGGGHGCAVLASGSVWCWGRNEFGELGTGVESDVASPAEAPELSPAESVATWANQSCVVLAESAGVACVGQNYSGVQGDGRFYTSSTTAVAVPGSVGAIAIDLHGSALVALEDGSILSWGGFMGPLSRRVDSAVAATGQEPTASLLVLSDEPTASPDEAADPGEPSADESVDDDPDAAALGLVEAYVAAVRSGDDGAIAALLSTDAVEFAIKEQPFDDPEISCFDGGSAAYRSCSYLSEAGIVELTINVEQREITNTTIIFFGD